MHYMISGKANLRKTIEFEDPAYVPCTFDLNLDWLKEKDQAKIEQIQQLRSQFPADILGGLSAAKNRTEPERNDGVLQWTDEWGTGWVDDGHGAKTDYYPLMEGYSQLDKFGFPDPLLEGRFDAADGILGQRGSPYARCTVWFTLFERLWMLRGFDNLLVDPYLEEKNFCRLRDRVLEYNLSIIGQWMARKVDGVFFSDDWGCQRGLLMDPADWRKFYKGAYRAMFEQVRSGGAHVWMHLCGDITEILPDLIDIGLNVLNPVQPQAMDVAELGRNFGGSVCFNGGVDVQGTMVNGTPNEVEKEVHYLVKTLGSFGGGYIGGTSHSIMPETPLDNIIAMHRAFLKYQ
jgi:uroporphyrinogen decarboxylase